MESSKPMLKGGPRVMEANGSTDILSVGTAGVSPAEPSREGVSLCQLSNTGQDVRWPHRQDACATQERAARSLQQRER